MGNCLSSCLPVGGRQRRGLLDGVSHRVQVFSSLSLSLSVSVSLSLSLSLSLPLSLSLTSALLQDNETQNLFDDPHVLQYGSFDQHHDHGREDPLEVQREIEALQRIIARTSEYALASPVPDVAVSSD